MLARQRFDGLPRPVKRLLGIPCSSRREVCWLAKGVPACHMCAGLPKVRGFVRGVSSGSEASIPPAVLRVSVLKHSCTLTTVTPYSPHPQIPLHVFSYKDLYGWTMDEIVAAVGTKSNCTFCGVFRRQVGGNGVCVCLCGLLLRRRQGIVSGCATAAIHLNTQPAFPVRCPRHWTAARRWWVPTRLPRGTTPTMWRRRCCSTSCAATCPGADCQHPRMQHAASPVVAATSSPHATAGLFSCSVCLFDPAAAWAIDSGRLLSPPMQAGPLRQHHHRGGLAAAARQALQGALLPL